MFHFICVLFKWLQDRCRVYQRALRTAVSRLANWKLLCDDAARRISPLTILRKKHPDIGLKLWHHCRTGKLAVFRHWHQLNLRVLYNPQNEFAWCFFSVLLGAFSVILMCFINCTGYSASCRVLWYMVWEVCGETLLHSLLWYRPY